MKVGDLVEILESTMGTKLSRGVVGVIVQKAFTSPDSSCTKWSVLVNGKVRVYDQSLLNGS
jgi:hypothetical protein